MARMGYYGKYVLKAVTPHEAQVRSLQSNCKIPRLTNCFAGAEAAVRLSAVLWFSPATYRGVTIRAGKPRHG
jgi:hypothetical protein